MSEATSTEIAIGLDAFDTSATSDEGAVMEVRSPNGVDILRWPDGRPYTVTLLGADSDKVVKIARQQQDKRSQYMTRTRAPVPMASIEKDNVELLVAATKSWDIPLGDGQPAKNNPNEYRAAYTKYRWLYDQANEWIGNRGNFLRASAKD